MTFSKSPAISDASPEGPDGPAPDLTDELVELILVARLRQVSYRLTTTDLSDLLPPLMAMTRTYAPAVTKAALNDLPWIDLDFASRVGDVVLMDLMVDLEKRRNGRPLQWTHQALTAAARHGHVHVLDWWLTQPHLQVEWVSLWKPAVQGGHVAVLEWWARSGLKMYFSQPAMPLKTSTIPGIKACVLWTHEHRDQLIWEADEAESKVRATALVQRLVEHSYCADVYDWALEQASEYPLDCHAILTNGLRHGAPEASEWAVKRLFESPDDLRLGLPKIIANVMPVTVKWRRGTQPQETASPPESGFCKNRSLADALSSSAGRRRVDWFTKSDAGWKLLIFAGPDHVKRLIMLAAQAGDVATLQRVEEKGHLSLSNGLLLAAIGSGDLDMVAYVLDRMSAVPVEECHCPQCVGDPFNAVSGRKPSSLAILDYLLAHGLSPRPELAKDYLTGAIVSKQVPFITWWMQHPVCTDLLAQDPDLLPTLVPRHSLRHALFEDTTEFLAWLMDHMPGGMDFEASLDPEDVFMAISTAQLDVLKILYQRVPLLLREYAMYPQHRTVMVHPQFQAMYGRDAFQPELQITAIDALSASSDTNTAEALAVLNWWFYETDLPLYYTTHAMDAASRYGAFPILDWWLAHADRLELKYSPAALNTQCNGQQYRAGNDGAFRLDTRVLQWWAKSGLRLHAGIWLAVYQCDHQDHCVPWNTAIDGYLCGNSAANLPLLMQCVGADQQDMDHMLEELQAVLKPPVGRLVLRMCLGHYRPGWMQDEDSTIDVSHFTSRATELFGPLWDDRRASQSEAKYLKSFRGFMEVMVPGMGLPVMPMMAGFGQG